MRGKGIVVPPLGRQRPALIMGDREFLEKLRNAVEEALESCVSRVEVRNGDGSVYPVVVALDGEAPTIYYGDDEPESVKDWDTAFDIAEEYDDFCYTWDYLNGNLTYLLIYLLKVKSEKETDPDKLRELVGKYHYLQQKLSELFWDEKNCKRLKDLKDFKKFFRELSALFGFPHYCFRMLHYGDIKRETIEHCVNLSLYLYKKGFPENSLEAIGVIDTENPQNSDWVWDELTEVPLPPEPHPESTKRKHKRYFLFLLKREVPAELLENDWILDGRRLFIPLENR